MNQLEITLNQAKALKALGYDEEVFNYYKPPVPFIQPEYGRLLDPKNYNQWDGEYSAPDRAAAIRWFREKFGLHGHYFKNVGSWVYIVQNVERNSMHLKEDKQYVLPDDAESALIDALIVEANKLNQTKI